MSANDCMTVARQQLLQCKKSGRDKARKEKEKNVEQAYKEYKKGFYKNCACACLHEHRFSACVSICVFVCACECLACVLCC